MERIQKRFDELAETADEIFRTFNEVDGKRLARVQQMGEPTRYVRTTRKTLDRESLIQWQTSVLNLLSRVFKEESPTFKQFQNALNPDGSTIQDRFKKLHAIFLSAKDDFEGGCLFDVRKLIHADVFDDELEQAEYFLKEGYKVPAAVIAGTVLESCLRQLCDDHDVDSGNTLNPMNDALGKEGVLNKLQKKQITAWADIRNSAAHGHPDNFDNSDVEQMIFGVRIFVATKLS